MEEDIEYQKNRIIKIIAEMESVFEEINFLEAQIDDSDFETWHDEIIARDEHKSNFVYMAKSLYLTTIAFLEEKRAHSIQKYFLDQFAKYYNDDKEVFKGYWYLEIGEYVSNIVSDYRQLLSVYQGFGYDTEQIKKRSGIFYLESILESTAVIIRDLNKKVTTETEVYKAVEVVCKATFRDVSFSTSSFSTTAKTYKPDILIPSLNCAIEYKYAVDMSRLIRTVEEILVDVQGYASNKDYKLFYAVFYVKAGVSTKSRFGEIWKEKNFPDNWKHVYVEWT